MKIDNPIALLILLALSTAPFFAHSSPFEYKPLLTGERAAGLAGAFVALSDDQSGMLYNPAGLVRADAEGTAATVNVLSSHQTEYENVFGGTSWTRSSVDLIPGFTGSLGKPDENTAYGFSIVVLDAGAEDQTDQFEDVSVGTEQYDELRVHNNFSSVRYLFGVSGARALNNEWSIGMSLYIDYEDLDRSFTQRLSDDADPLTVQDDKVALVQVQRENSSIGIRPVLGIHRISGDWRYGLSVTQTIPISRDYFYAYSASLNGFGNNDIAFDLIDKSDDTVKQPLEISIGIANQVSDDLLWTMQIDHYTSRVIASPQDASKPPRDLSAKSVTNFAVALEKAIGSDWLYRTGLYTNFANNNAREASPFERREEIDAYGVTFSVTRAPEKKRPWTLGVQVESGNGEATLGDVGFGGNGETVDASTFGLNAFVSTTW